MLDLDSHMLDEEETHYEVNESTLPHPYKAGLPSQLCLTAWEVHLLLIGQEVVIRIGVLSPKLILRHFSP